MKWLTNTHDPNNPNARIYVLRAVGETQEEAWQKHLEWLQGKVIGEPMPSDNYTVEQMKAMGMVGVYLP